jgi:hypothetical protein
MFIKVNTNQKACDFTNIKRISVFWHYQSYWNWTWKNEDSFKIEPAGLCLWPLSRNSFEDIVMISTDRQLIIGDKFLAYSTYWEVSIWPPCRKLARWHVWQQSWSLPHTWMEQMSTTLCLDIGPGAFAMVPGGVWLQQEHTASPFTSE